MNIDEGHKVLRDGGMSIDEAVRIAKAHEGDSERAEAAWVLAEEVERLRTAWVTVPLRWRHTAPGDAFVGAGAVLWRITGTGPAGAQWRLDVARAGEVILPYVGDPDQTVDVLVPVAERDGYVLLREQLGAAITERRTA